MVVDGSTKKFGLFVGQGDRKGLGFDFSSPAPGGSYFGAHPLFISRKVRTEETGEFLRRRLVLKEA